MLHPTKKWELTIMELESDKGKKYKVTRRLPEMSVAETRVFPSKRRARAQLEQWLQ